MKLYKAFFLSLALSWFTGALIFLGIPLLCGLARADGRFWESGLIIGMVMYVIYVIIQFWLSVINLAQAVYMHSRGRLNPGKEGGLTAFFIAQGILYCVIFVGLAVAFADGEAVVFILAFSALYIVCCTASVYYFGFTIMRLNARIPVESQKEAQDETI